ncbi:MAG: hypothetical protein IJP80_08275 [Bacteroidales bacterium]|nr:hypothetical protein [Bacteroidales bacterium]
MKVSDTPSFSRTCLVGQLNVRDGFDCGKLEENPKLWRRSLLTEKEFRKLDKKYYTAHLLSMAEVVRDVKVERPCDLSAVRRYDMIFPEEVDSGDLFKDYPCRIERVSVWFFPCEVILFSIEIDDSGRPLNDITLMHGSWKEWDDNYADFGTKSLDNLLKPLSDLTKAPDKPDNLCFQNTKMRQYQVVQCDDDRIDDELLYEVATFSKIGVIGDPNQCARGKPSQDYYEHIMAENSVSAFSNWKALALNDSFTVLAIDGIYSDSELDSHGDGYRYFEMLYMRCLVQEFYCFSRNNGYREKSDVDLFAEEHNIELMEKYYFYDDFSYDFLPNMMYQAMVKGLGLQGDREELTLHVKQALREKRRRNNEIVVNSVKIFAVITVFWTLYTMFTTIFECLRGSVTAAIFTVLAFVTWLKFHNLTREK